MTPRTPFWTVIGISLLLASAAPHTAAAQEPTRSFNDLAAVVSVGDTVSVLTPAGTLATGRLTGLTASMLSLDVQGATRTFSEADVSRVLQRRRDPLGNGAQWGLGIGAALFAVPILVTGGSGATGYAIVFGAVFGGIGAGIGAAVDAGRTSTYVIYTRPSGTTTSVRLAPIVGATRAGAAVTIGF